MPHLYIHIPFCRQACHYCDFHFSTTLHQRGELVAALCTEIEQRAGELPNTILETIYFGGGTPSLLEPHELDKIFATIRKHFTWTSDAEITLEANPDDLSETYLTALRETPVNRLSIGIQSFRTSDLEFMNRAHTANDAIEAVKRAQGKGFSNITVDLIYGIPNLSDEDWVKNLEHVFALQVQHLSAYCLTVEPRTALAHLVKTGKSKPVDDEQAARQFQLLIHHASANGFQQYEISNFATHGFHARHNSSYWNGEPYLGIGPSAHSFDGAMRRWNVSNNSKYMRAVQAGESFSESEILTENERYNEYVMTRLRTIWGCDLKTIEARFGVEVKNHFLREIDIYWRTGDVHYVGTSFTLSTSGKLIADRIASDLFL